MEANELSFLAILVGFVVLIIGCVPAFFHHILVKKVGPLDRGDSLAFVALSIFGFLISAPTAWLSYRVTCDGVTVLGQVVFYVWVVLLFLTFGVALLSFACAIGDYIATPRYNRYDKG